MIQHLTSSGTDNFLGITALSTQPASRTGLSDFRDESTGFHPRLINSRQIDSLTSRVLIIPQVCGGRLWLFVEARGHMQVGDRNLLRGLKDWFIQLTLRFPKIIYLRLKCKTDTK